jgi:phospholipid/cholesterol/gamma-HCH transport system substrate-binding protein
VQGERSDNPSKGRILARVAGVGALLVGVVLIALVLFGGDKGYGYKLLFETGGQLVPGNQVLVGGQPIGTVDDIKLTENAQAEVKITTDAPLHEGTTAVIRATSLSGIANRYVSIAPGPNSEPQIPENTTIPSTQTTSPVDIDQLFDTFNKKTRQGLADFIQGQGTVYTNNGNAANKAYKFLAPGLQSTSRLLAELTRDQQTFSDFLASGSRVLGAIAERRDDLASLTTNANQALAAIAQENDSFDRSLVALPPALRQANTTFVNLRAALDDLDPLIVATGEATQAGLTPFLRKLGTVADDSVPLFKNLGLVLHRDGPANDLVDTLGALPGAQRRAVTAIPANIKALDDSQPKIAQLRPYTPDLLAFLARFGQATSNYDGNGHYLRVQPTGINLFRWNSLTSVLDPIPTSQQFADFDNGFFNRCPGGSTQPITGSNPFLDDGNLDGFCNPDDTPQGP